MQVNLLCIGSVILGKQVRFLQIYGSLIQARTLR
jgi:hypothetical protein